MSTKIYNGYVSKLNLEQLLTKFKCLVSEFKEIKANGYGEHLVEETVFQIDRMHYKNSPVVDQFDLLREKNKTNEEEVENTVKKGLRSPSLDFTASCSVFPIKKNKTLILFYSDNPLITKHWESLNYIAEYHYQNQTDPPEDISSYMWNKRENEWEKALGGFGIPRENGYSFTFTDERLPWLRNIDKKKFIPSKDKRALHLLHDNFLDKAIKDIMEEEKVTEFRFSILSKAKDKWFEFKKTKEFKEQMKELKKSLPKIDLEYKQNGINT